MKTMRQRPIILVSVIAGAIIGAIVGFYNGLFSWHDLRAVGIWALGGSILGYLIANMTHDAADRKTLRRAILASIIGAGVGVFLVLVSGSGQNRFISETLNWAALGFVVGLLSDQKATTPLIIGAMIGAVVALVASLTAQTPHNIELGSIQVAVSNQIFFVAFQTLAGAFIGAFFGMLFNFARTPKQVN